MEEDAGILTVPVVQKAKMKMCIRCKNSYPESFFYKRGKALRAECKLCFSQSRKLYYENNKDIVRERQNKYYKKNKEQISSYKSKWQKENSERRRVRLNERYRTEPNFRMSVNLRTRLLKAIENKQKSGSTLDLLGCSIEYFTRYLESKFIDNMSWDNHGTVWHIDHIKPCSKFDLSKPDHQKVCFHYTNMQPLFAEDNLKKGNRFYG